MENYTPMMKHYLSLKETNKDSILFYRLGDFYEMFFEDAQLVSKLLGLTLTKKSCGTAERAPMCGVPYHSAQTYISRLIDMGYKVAICEQLTEAKKNEMVNRDIVRIITPGTVMEEEILDVSNNYIASVCLNTINSIGLSWLDLSTGEFNMAEYKGDKAFQKLNDALTSFKPSEIISNSKAFDESCNLPCVRTEIVPKFYQFLDFCYEFTNASQSILNQLKIGSLTVLNCSDKPEGVCASGALLAYISQTQKRSLEHINKLNIEQDDSFLYIDASARLNLELNETIFERKRRGSLLWVLDQTKTSMGRRTLEHWLDKPLRDENIINNRLDAVDELTKNTIARNELIDILSGVSDIERICGRVSYGSVGPRGCVDIQKSLKKFPKIKNLLKNFNSPLLKEINKNIEDFSALQQLLEKALKDEAPVSAKDGDFIKSGFSAELDKFLSAKKDGKTWIAELENKERELTGIKSLKIKFNNILGYFFDIPSASKDKVPYRFLRKQSLANSDRFTTEDLTKLAEDILNAEENIQRLEQEIFNYLKEEIKKQTEKIQTSANQISILDVLISFACVSIDNRYVKPTINSKIKEIKIIGGRHPVVEKINKAERFVPNDTLLNEDCRTMIITGPNMSGKSTYMRQVALITIMAHLGCFVPATQAEIKICDRIFTRIGASDNLGMGQSTFMVEMIEVASILQNATKNSLLILDEIGRGTSTYDGLSIAWAVVEFITQKIKAYTLFATHYHEITELEGKIQGVKNYQVAVKEFNNSIIFLHNIIKGYANKSFGIEVAIIAGINKEVITRAREVLHYHEQQDFNSSVQSCSESNNNNDDINQQILQRVREIEPNILTPIEALSVLAELKNLLKGQE